ncbi:MAG: SBBP repeat-containing protein [Chitinophagales bacterium]
MKKYLLLLGLISAHVFTRAQNPVLQKWGTYLGGLSRENVTAVQVDKNGNLYVTGNTTSPTGIASSGAYQQFYSGGSDGFIFKFNKNGQRLWSTYYGGPDDDYIYGCAVDTFGNVFISGTTHSSSGIAFNGYKNTINSFPSQNYGTDAFLVKFNAAGIRQWGTYLGSIVQEEDLLNGTYYYSENQDYGFGCATDLSGNVVIVGRHPFTDSLCYDALGQVTPCQNTLVSTPGALKVQPDNFSADNAFAVKFSGAGTRLWGTYLGAVEPNPTIFSPTNNFVYCAIDRAGNVYVSAQADSSDAANLGVNGYLNTAPSRLNIWLAKVNDNGNTLLWSTYYGGYGDECANGLATDSAGNIFLTGTTSTTNNGYPIATPGAFVSSWHSYGPVPFLVKFKPNGSRVWGTFLQADGGQSYAGGCAADATGHVYATSYLQSVSGSSFPLNTFCGDDWVPQGFGLSKFDGAGKRIWSDLRGTLNTSAPVCATDNDGRFFYWGLTTDITAHPIALNAYQAAVAGNDDGAVLCFTDTAIYDTVCGFVFRDANTNSVMDNGEGYLPSINVSASIHQQTFSALTDSNGFFRILVPGWHPTGGCRQPLRISTSPVQVITWPLSGEYDLTSPQNGCQYHFGIADALEVSGKLYYDTNHDGIDNSEPGIFNSVSFNNSVQAFSNGDGKYRTLLPSGTYTELFAASGIYNNAVSNPSSYLINTSTTSWSQRNFGVYFNTNLINSAVVIWQQGAPPVPGHYYELAVKVTNAGSLPCSNEVTFHYDSMFTFQGNISGGVIDYAAHTITWLTDTMAPGSFSTFQLPFLVSSGAVPGSITHNWVTVNPSTQPDVDTADNIANYYCSVMASYDPNFKISLTNTDTPNVHLARLWSNGHDFIQYEVHFQNTGNFKAENVVVLDTLSQQLDVSTLQIISTSHSCDIELSGNVLSFRFPNIDLTPVSVSDSLSTGFVIFKIKPTYYSLPGARIDNRAAIYFDFNHAVFTPTNEVRLKGDTACRQSIWKNIYVSTCLPFHHIFKGDTLTTFGIYYDTLQSITGCDSIVALHLVRKPPIENHIYLNLCAFGNYIFYGDTIRAKGVFYGDTLQNAIGCDSIDVLHVTSNSLFSNRYVYSCDSASLFEGDTLKGYGLHILHRTSTGGCDSLLYVWLLTGGTKYGTVNVLRCSPDTIVFGGQLLYQAGTYYDTIRGTQLGECDSITTLHLMYGNFSTVTYIDGYLCGSYYIFGGDTLWHSGSYTDTLVGAAGCDSIIHLSLYNNYLTNNQITYCHTGKFLYRGHYYNYWERDYDTLIARNGCDSIIITQFVRNVPFQEIENSIQCQLGSYVFRGRTFNLAHEFIPPSHYIYLYDTLHLAAGCDSVVVAKIFLDFPIAIYHEYLPPCRNAGTLYSFPDTGSANYHVYHTPAGCDSVIYVDFYTTPTNQTLHVCTGDSLYWHHQWRFPGKHYVDHFSSTCGVDSVVNVVVDSGSNQYEWRDRFICEGDTLMVKDRIINSEGYYIDTIGMGCYALFVHNQVSFYPGAHGSFSTYDYLNGFGGSTPHGYIIPPAQFKDTFLSVCHDTPVVQTIIYNTYADAYFDSVVYPNCSSKGLIRLVTAGDNRYHILWNTGDTAHLLTNLESGGYWVNIYDSLGHLITTRGIYLGNAAIQYRISPVYCFNQIDTVTITASFVNNPAWLKLDSFTIPIYHNGSAKFEHINPGIHQAVFHDGTGCNDTFSLFVPGNAITLKNLTPASCSSNISSRTLLSYAAYYGANAITTINIDGGMVVRSYNQWLGTDTLKDLTAGWHHYTVKNTIGCSKVDSFFVPSTSPQYLNASLKEYVSQPCSQQSIIRANITHGQPPFHYQWTGGNTTDSSTIQLPDSIHLQLADANGCTASLSRFFTIHQSEIDSHLVSHCGHYIFDGKTLVQSGYYSDTLVNYSGCDSIVILNLEIKQPSFAQIAATLCNGQRYRFAHRWMTATGTYVASYQKTNGCDSIIELHLQFDTIPKPVIFFTAGRLSTSGIYQAYQWLLNGQAIPHADSINYTPVSGGSYKLIVFNANGCSDTSANFSVTDIPSVSTSSIAVYPNPNDGHFAIENAFERYHFWAIIDALGRKVAEGEIKSNLQHVDLSYLANGAYFLEIINERKVASEKFVVLK